MDVFKLKANQTTVGREIMAGMVTFMAMAYIIFVNPKILAAAMGNELFPALVLATCLGAGILSILMGLISNYPLALASGMGLNAFLAYGVIMGMKVPWPTAMGIIFVEGVIITILVLTNVRKQVMDAIPLDLKRAIGVGIGLLITVIGLENAKLIVSSPATLITFGKIGPESRIALAGILFSAWLMAKKIKGSFLLGIIFCTVVAALAGLVSLPKVWIAGIRPEYFKTIFALDIVGAMRLGLMTTIFAFLITDFFDTMGTVVAVGEQGGFMDRDGQVPRLKNILLVDSLGAVGGGLLGCSSVTTYVESAAGVAEGGRTGLTSVVSGCLFLLAIFFTPIVAIVPGYATAPALILVGFLLIAGVRSIAWDDITTALPVFLTITMIPFTFISSLLVSPVPFYSLKKSLLYLPYFCGFYALFQVLDSREKLIRAWDFFYLCGGWVITLSIPFFFLQILHFDAGMVRVRLGNLWLTGPIVIANIFGSTAAIIFIIALVRIMKRLPEKRARWFDYLFLAAAVSGVMLCYTRSAMFGILLGFILVLLAMLRIMPFKKIIMPFILTLMISVVFTGIMYIGQKEASRIYFTQEEVGGKVGSSLAPVLDKYSNFFSRTSGWGWRYMVFSYAFKDWQANPWLGMGSESLIAKNGYSWEYYISSTWLTVLHDWGIGALLLHLFFMLLVFIGLVKIFFLSKEDDIRELSLSLIVVLIVSTLMYQSTTTMQLAIFWILLAFYNCVVLQFSIPSARKS